MEWLNNLSQLITTLFSWWFVVAPWEQAIHTRKGRLKKICTGGLYFRIPFIDAVYTQTSKLRMLDGPMQTLTSRDGQAMTIKCVYGYAISDIYKLYCTLYHPDMTLGSMIAGKIGETVRSNDANAISPKMLEEEVLKLVKSDEYGLSGIVVRVSTFAIVKTFRLIQDGSTIYENTSMAPIK
jgi:hypothetical protein